jgi:O-antigen ligase
MVAPAVFYTLLLAVSAVLSFANGTPEYVRGSWTSPNLLDHFADWKNRISFVFLAPLAFRLIWTPRHLRTMVKLIAIITILIVAQSLWDVREIVLSGMKIETNRAIGMIAAQPNLFGGFLALVLAMYVPVFLAGGAIPKSERLLYAVLLGAGGMDLLFTLSRGAWLALVLGLSLVALFRGAKLVVLLLVLGLTAPLWLPKSVVDRVELTKQGSNYDPEQTFDDSTQVRVDQWNALPEMMAEAPILGHGFRSFPSVWYRFGPDHRPKAAHSSIIEFATEEGVIGVLAYAWLVSALFRGGWRARRLSTDPIARELAVGLMAACVCLVMLDSSGTRFRSSAVMAYVWIVGGAIHRMASVPTATSGARVTPPLRRA